MQKDSYPLKVGLGRTIITPPANVQMYGFARSQVSTGVHDDLYAKTLIVESGGKAAVLLVLSLCGLGREYVERIRGGISEKTGIPEEHILISCTHTHAGPRVGDANIQNVGAADREYPEFLIRRAVESTLQAYDGRFPARIGVGTTKVLELGRHRRKLLYGGLHPDPEVGIIKIEDAEGSLKGVAYIYGCHPSTLDWQNTLFSEDWVYYANRGIGKELGENIWVAYFQSAEGDINTGYLSELSAVGVDLPIRNYEYLEIKGNQMSDAVLKALDQKILLIGRDIPLQIKHALENPESVGTDRLLTASAAYAVIEDACVVADFGTATTIDCVDHYGIFLGGTIQPGLQLAAQALSQHTAALPEVSPVVPLDDYGNNTEKAIQHGIYFGAVGALRGIVERYATLLGRWPQVVLTGGYAKLIAQHADFADSLVPDLCLDGIFLAYRNFRESQNADLQTEFDQFKQQLNRNDQK